MTDHEAMQPPPEPGSPLRAAPQPAGKKKKERKNHGEEVVSMDMTPMIDVVFNLIIFFMVITDMTQQDLEYLVLPKVPMAVKDLAEDKERLIVNIVDPNIEDMKGRVDLSKPPVFFRGRQVEDLDDLRSRLKVYADPRVYKEIWKQGDERLGKMPLVDPKTGLHHSRKPLLIRCDQGQVFGWVQAIMQYCTFVPGRDRGKELADSPFIYKIEIAVADPSPPK